jgi:large subunit ribosomal protein L7/L12
MHAHTHVPMFLVRLAARSSVATAKLNGGRGWVSTANVHRTLHVSVPRSENDEAVKVVKSTDPVDPKIVQLIDEICALNLVEASQLADALKDKLGISDAPMMAMPMAGGAIAPGGGAGPEEAEIEEEKTHFSIKLNSFEASSKLKVIKEVRALSGLGLKEAKEFVEAAATGGKVVKENVAKEEAEEMLEKLKAVGADASLE